MYPTLRKHVEGLQDGIIRFTQDLVRTSSLSLCETEVAWMVESKMRDLEYDMVFTDEIGNIVGVIRGGDPSFTVVLNSHMDTVRPDPVSAWSFPPFSGEIVDDRITGVGAADCKSGIATQVFAAHALARSVVPLGGTVVVAATVAEENGCSVGARHLFRHTLPQIGLTPRFVVLGEPTGLKVGSGHDGWARFDIDVMGVDEDTVRWTVHQICDILSLYSGLSGSPPSPDIIATEPPLHCIRNECICERVAVVHRLFEGETVAEVLGWLSAILGNGFDLALNVAVDVRLHEEMQRPYTGKSVHVNAMSQPWFTDLRHPLIEHAREALVSAGFKWAPEPWLLDRLGMGTAGSFITSEIGIPTIGFGPGEVAQAHACDESVSIPNLVEAAFGTAAIACGLVGLPLEGARGCSGTSEPTRMWGSRSSSDNRRKTLQSSGLANRKEVIMDRNESENLGDEGFCICLECNTRLPRRSWVTCIERNCPYCGAIMVREGSPYHQYALEQGLASHGRFISSSRKSTKKDDRKGRTHVVLGHSC